RDDILWFARRFLAEKCRVTTVNKRLSIAAESALLAHAWPGNIRELHHAIERACILSSRPVIEPEDLFESAGGDGSADSVEGDVTLGDYLQRCERYFLVETLDRHGWQIGATAKALAISRKNLWERMRRLGITASDAREDETR
ncbi:MAG: sigma-54-dependent Fis family transcriptional regulator, partial [Betaproteobacteria bacterium]|nr:sigma-54-dependent Fis family transcriptional regulator [Betaproteobacteria bacterium]